MTTALEGGEGSASKKDPIPTVQEAGSQGRSGRAENLVPTGIRSRTVQPVAQSLYRLSYPAHTSYTCTHEKCIQNFSSRIRPIRNTAGITGVPKGNSMALHSP